MSDDFTPTIPSFAPSIRPSGVFQMELPFGNPPVSLESKGKPIRLPEDIRKTVRALSNNADKVRRRSPLIAAQCWHEAGRLLNTRGGRLADAWICYNRALAVYPDYSPSLSSLIRLARLAEDIDVLFQLLCAKIDKTPSVSEKAALITEAASISIRLGDFADAKKKLKTAIAISDNALVPRILLAVLSSKISNENEREIIISSAKKFTSDSLVRKALERYLALFDEKRRTSSNSDSDRERKQSISNSLPALWIELRTALALGQNDESIAVLDNMLSMIEDKLLFKTCKRLRDTLSLIMGESNVPDDNSEADVFRKFLIALINNDQNAIEYFSSILKNNSSTSNWKNTLALFSMIKERQVGKLPRFSFGPSGIPTYSAKGVYNFLTIAAPKDNRNPIVDGKELADAIIRKNNAEIAAVLIRLREETIDADAVWPIRVVESALEFEETQHGRPSIVPSPPSEEEVHRVPLPSIMRRSERRHRRLAELCIGEAKNSDDAEFIASRLSWAGFHLETLDPFESARLYTEALTYCPSLLFAIKGLERTGTHAKEAATLYLHAASESRDSANRASALLRAGILLLISGNEPDSVRPLSEAALLLPEEEGLQKVTFNMAMTYPQKAASGYLSFLLSDKASFVHPSLLGAFLHFTKPEAACRFFEKALQQQPDDPLAKLGLTESLLRSDRASIVSEQLFAGLRQSSSPTEEAFYYQRLSHIDRFHRNDQSSSALFTESLITQLPEHQSSLIRLVVYYLQRRLLTALSLSLSNDSDTSAIARLCTLEADPKSDYLSHITTHFQPTLLDLTVLESVSSDKEEKLALLEKIANRVPQSMTYLSRLADCRMRLGSSNEAATLYKQSMQSKLTVFHSLNRTAECLRDTNLDSLLLDTLVIAADIWTKGEFKAKALTDAAYVALERLGDPEKAVELCLLSLAFDPEDDEAFTLAETLLTTQLNNPSQYLSLLQARLDGYCDVIDEIVIRSKMFDIAKQTGEIQTGDEESRFADILQLITDNRPDEHADDWDQKLFLSMTSSQKLTASHYVGLYLNIGRYYHSNVENTAYAVKYYQEALSADEECFEALIALADILAKEEQSISTQDVLSRLVFSLRTRPDDILTYNAISSVSAKMQENLITSSAFDMRTMLGSNFGGFFDDRWKIPSGVSISDKVLDEYFCPSEITPLLRKVFSKIEIPLAGILKIDFRSDDNLSLSIPKRKDNVTLTAAKLAPLFGISDFSVFIYNQKMRLLFGELPVILMPQEASVSKRPGIAMFTVAAAFQWLRLNLTLPVFVEPNRLKRLLSGLARIYSDVPFPSNISEKSAKEEADMLQETLSADILESLEPLSDTIMEALTSENLHLHALSAGYRAGLLFCGSLPTAISGIRTISAIHQSTLIEIPGAAELISFAFSSDFIDLANRYRVK